jgi:prepilin-type N-terminal cleavage/methylation domain-containing protein
MKMFHRGEKGFTLIELLIVVAILGIIAAVVIPNISGFMITGELSAANSEAENVKTAALGYFGEYGDWPDTSDDLVPNYITGTMKATYDISGPSEGNFGWLLGATNQTWNDGITFAPGVDASDGNHGKWVRVP